MKPVVRAFFDEDTNTVSYVVKDPAGKDCAIIDSVLDFDQASCRTSTASADQLLRYINEQELNVLWILETHTHADHLTAASYLRSKTGGRIGTGKLITRVPATFKRIYNLEDEFIADGNQFDRLFDDGEQLKLGSLHIEVMHTPGHTPACVTFLIGDAAFVGDTLFMPDFGTARADFPDGDAAVLFQSIQRIFELPPNTRLFMCHDYKAPGRDEFGWETSVEQQRAQNVHIHDGVSEQSFVEFRQARDAQLGMPKLILPSSQVNIRAGELPSKEGNGIAYLKFPINAL